MGSLPSRLSGPLRLSGYCDSWRLVSVAEGPGSARGRSSTGGRSGGAKAKTSGGARTSAPRAGRTGGTSASASYGRGRPATGGQDARTGRGGAPRAGVTPRTPSTPRTGAPRGAGDGRSATSGDQGRRGATGRDGEGARRSARPPGSEPPSANRCWKSTSTASVSSGKLNVVPAKPEV